MYLLYPIEIRDGDNDDVVFTENGATKVATVEAGTYWPYRNAASSTPWPSLYDEIESAMATAGGNEYEISLADPSSSTEFTNGTVEIARTSGSDDFQLAPNDSDFTADPRIFGFNEDDALLGETDTVTGGNTRLGCWQVPDQTTVDVDGNVLVDQNRNDAPHQYGQTVRWRTNEVRILTFKWVAAAYIYRYLSSDDEARSTTKLAEDDHGNYFEDLWREAISKYLHVFVVDEDYPSDIELDVAPWEVVYPSGESSVADDMSESVSERDVSASFYDIDNAFWRVPADDDRVADFDNYIDATTW